MVSCVLETQIYIEFYIIISSSGFQNLSSGRINIQKIYSFLEFPISEFEFSEAKYRIRYKFASPKRNLPYK